MKTFKDYTDEYGCLIRKEYGTITGGDSLSYLGFYHTLKNYNASKEEKRVNALDFTLRLYAHRGSDGIYVRHPASREPFPFTNSIYKTSRDQYMPLFTACALLGRHQIARTIAKPIFKIRNHVNRFAFMFNIMRNGEPNWDKEPNQWVLGKKAGDFIGIEQVGTIIRACGLWYLYPVLLFTDCFNLLSSIWKVIESYLNPSHTDDQTRICTLLCGLKKYPTPMSYLAWIVYKKYRAAWTFQYWEHLKDWWFFEGKEEIKKVFSNFKLDKSKPGWQYALDTRFGGDNEPPFNDLAKKVLLEK